MNARLNDIEWKEFYLKEIFPEIQRGKRLKNNNHLSGKIPYASSTSLNNGIDDFVRNEDKVRIFSECLTLANSGSVGACFYQPFRFVASDHVTKLGNSNLSKYSYLFIATIVSRLAEKYSFNREINDFRIRKEKILLPVTSAGQPDYSLMEDYMREKEKAILMKYRNYITQKMDYSIIELKPLSEKNWQEFKIGNLFVLEQGKSKGLNHLSETGKGINYLGATNQNNGVLCQVEVVEKLTQKGNCIAFIRNGEGSMGYSVYKTEDFIATSDMSLGYNPYLNKYNGTFMTTVADRVRGKYNFGYKRSGTRLAKESLLLPTDENGNPDYKYMEQYMRSLEQKNILQYLDYLESQHAS